MVRLTSGSNDSNTVIECIGYIDEPSSVHGHPEWAVEAALQSGAAIPIVSGHAVSGHTHNNLLLPMPTSDQMTVGIGNQQMPLAIERNPIRPREAGGKLMRIALISIFGAIPSHGANDAGFRINLANTPIEGIGNVQRAIGIDR